MKWSFRCAGVYMCVCICVHARMCLLACVCVVCLVRHPVTSLSCLWNFSLLFPLDHSAQAFPSLSSLTYLDMLLLYLYQIFIFLLGHLHFFFSSMENLFKKHPISCLFSRKQVLTWIFKGPASPPLEHLPKPPLPIPPPPLSPLLPLLPSPSPSQISQKTAVDVTNR